MAASSPVACAYLVIALVTLTDAYKVDKYALLMPNVRPYRPELYLCTPVKIDFSKNYYIVGFEPNATMETSHHILLYGCTTPGSNEAVWNCGEMASSTRNEKTASPCEKGSQVIYAWARDAPPTHLPDGVGFKVGGDSPIKYLVLQVHYAHIDKFKDGSTDSSGLFLRYTERPMNKLAGVILLGTSGIIRPHSIEHMESSCEIDEDKRIYPYAFRTHTHSLGRVVSGYVVRPDEYGVDQWTLLGKRDPQKPQMFYPVKNSGVIIRGDKLAARCTMASDKDETTYIGPTNNDEMCNFYLMYYVENETPLKRKYCFTAGPPYYYWRNSLENIPDDDASTLE